MTQMLRRLAFVLLGRRQDFHRAARLLDRLQQAIDAKTLDAKGTINAESLVKARAIRRAKDGVRLLGRGELKAKLTIEVHGASKSAIAAVEKAGGTVKILAPAKKDEGEAA